MSKKTSKAQGRTLAATPTVLTGSPYPVRFGMLRNGLTEAEEKVGDYFLAKPQAAYLSITEVVDDSSLGYGTIIRFCRKMGCAGFQEFKVLLAQELGSLGPGPDRGRSSSITEYAEKVKIELSNTAGLTDGDNVLRIAKQIDRAGHVLVGGVAGSASAAAGFDYRLSRIGIRSTVICEGFNLGIRAASLAARDVFFAVSFSGATKDILSAAKTAKTRKAIVVSLTNFVRAPLVALADFSLFSATARDPLTCEIFSRISSEFVLDVLFNRIYEVRKNAKRSVERTFEAISDRRV